MGAEVSATLFELDPPVLMMYTRSATSGANAAFCSYEDEGGRCPFPLLGFARSATWWRTSRSTLSWSAFVSASLSGAVRLARFPRVILGRSAGSISTGGGAHGGAR